ncbi:MAG: exosome complex RNA-binding protein Rrp4 [Methermicoccaceae archaeon]
MRVVIPGEQLSEDVRQAEEGTYVADGNVHSQLYGMVHDAEGIRVIPFKGKYIPSEGDVLVGVISEIMSFGWIVDIASPYDSLLHIAEYPRRIDASEMDRYLSVGDCIVVVVKEVSPSFHVSLELKDGSAKTLKGGRLVEISHTKVPRLIGRKGSMITMLQEETGCSLHVAQNGRVWITGPSKWIPIVADLVFMIEEQAHTSGLTDRVFEKILEHKGNKRNTGHKNGNTASEESPETQFLDELLK